MFLRLKHFFEKNLEGGIPAPLTRRPSRSHDSQLRIEPHSRHHRQNLRGYRDGQGQRYETRPLTSQSPSSRNTKDYDLDLGSLWFAKTPPAFPPLSMSRDGKLTYSSSSGWSSSGVRKTYTFTAHVRDTKTLAGTKIRVTWDSSNPAVTVKAEQRHDPPPRTLSPSELASYRERFVDHLYIWTGSLTHADILTS